MINRVSSRQNFGGYPLRRRLERQNVLKICVIIHNVLPSRTSVISTVLLLQELSFKNNDDKSIRTYYYRKPWQRVKPNSKLYNMQYPNCKQGIYSLRSNFVPTTPILNPVKEEKAINNKPQENLVQREPVVQPLPVRSPVRNLPQVTQRHAQIQCAILSSNIRHEIGIQTDDDEPKGQRTFLVTPEYHRLNVKPWKQTKNPYEVWNVPPSKLPVRKKKSIVAIDERLIQPHSPRRVSLYPSNNFETIGDDDDNDEEQIIYSRKPQRSPRSHLPPNVKMICIRHDPHTTSY
ncbi:unnamed protein product [Didymodactylos carnosus]|uniref:Uncharacterized protein n=1 Tax=Didymodactylos carnosus TaxID=1234261 RepID=A0A814I019_9BILA|nr:unnamed protein product [Didymodactylos carnosus]CAF1017344.1 unnamed protein product [Didymodactylos carnosus]CAF3557052.1 unnamed protein product [Didymodactylos carnosus]CAF3788813.1 unnamed protein product [Didymodactylos carnosus]